MADKTLKDKNLATSLEIEEINSSSAISSENKNYLQTIPLIKQIVSFKLSYKYPDFIEDITQKVLLKLWKWKNNKQQVLTDVEWKKIAYVASQNEIKTFYSNKIHKETELKEDFLENSSDINLIEGNSAIETKSLLNFIWKIIPKLNQRQRFAILLNQDFITYLISHNCCKIDELASILGIQRSQMESIIMSLPLTDTEICKILQKLLNEEINEQKIWEARSKGKAKLLAELRKLSK